MDEVIAQAVASSGTFTKPAEKTFWGGYTGYSSDPDEYLWEAAHHPFFWVGPAEEDA